VFAFVVAAVEPEFEQLIAGQADRFLHHGLEKTNVISVEFTFGTHACNLTLKRIGTDLVFDKRQFTEGLEDALRQRQSLFVGHRFHDASNASSARKDCDLSDHKALEQRGSNLPAYLYWLQEKHPAQFRHIEEHIRLIAPFFDRFVLAPSRLNENKIKLEWRHKGSDAYFDAYSLSDGTLRFMCLATLLLQPQPPALILLDEPELGLHPSALRILAEMLEAASKNAQVILATQSVTLLNHFSPEDVIVAENNGLQTTFERLDPAKLQAWTQDFSLGELWEKNVIGGRP
jgi:predicted ATPase